MNSFAMVAALAGTFAGSAAWAQAKDQLVQTPALPLPERGSVAGAMSKLAFGVTDVSRGSFSLQLPIDLPSERGELAASVLPTYSPESGISEWGMGFTTDLAIRRFRVAGDLAFDGDEGTLPERPAPLGPVLMAPSTDPLQWTAFRVDTTAAAAAAPAAPDELTSPWGRLRLGSDGRWYPSGLKTIASVEASGTDFICTSADGTRYRFGGDQAIDTPRGIYGWMLDEVTTPVGDRTELSWITNESGRTFLAGATWGGRNGTPQYQLELVYEPLTRTFVDQRAGVAQVLDRRVREVRVKARNALTGSFETRWTYRLAYRMSTLGPAYYLESITKVHRSGAVEPALVYSYDDGKATLDAATLVRSAGLDTFLAFNGDGAIQPDKVAYLDLEQDGLVDLELNKDFSLLHQTANGWVTEPLPARTGSEDSFCRPSTSTANRARSLVRMTPGAREPQVVAPHAASSGGTFISICDRAGQPLYSQRHAGGWVLDGNTRVVDLNRDFRPDFVRVFAGGYEVLENTSSDSAYSFANHDQQPLRPVFTPLMTFAQDINGDGLVDLVGRSATGLTVWYGQGQLQFARDGVSFPIRNSDGTSLSSLVGYQLSFVDANRDGLADLVLSQGRNMLLFTNRGDALVRTNVPALSSLSFDFGYPVAIDLSGQGNSEVAVVRGGHLNTIDLSSARTGLVVSANDGKGTTVSFEYGRAAAAPGLVSRPAVVASVTRQLAGEPAELTRYEYGDARMHSAGKFLVGFASVVKTTPLEREDARLRHDDDVSGLLESSQRSDATTPYVRFSESRYEDAFHEGVRFRRLIRKREGVRSVDLTAELATDTRFLTYERDFCPVASETRNVHGVLTRQSTLSSISGIDDRLHCLLAAETLSGSHGDDTLDFTHSTQIGRNSAGQVTSVTAIGPAGGHLIQSASYTSDHRLHDVTLAGRGTTTIDYDANTGKLRKITGPEGVVRSIDEVDPVDDSVRKSSVDRGPGGQLTSWFGFDGFERLHSTWRDSGAANAAMPAEEIEYDWANADHPATVKTRTLFDAGGRYREAVDVMAADGATLASLARTPEGWTVSKLVSRDRSRGIQSRLARSHLTPADMGALGFAKLYTGTAELGVAAASGLGESVRETDTVQAGVVRAVRYDARLESGAIVTTAFENEVRSLRRATDDNGTVMWEEDGSGAHTAFQYDALGRRVGAVLPDGSWQRLRFDAYGNAASVERQGLARITYAYASGGDLASAKQVYDGAGRLERSIVWTRDVAGRVLTETNTKSDGQSRTYAYDYDGVVPGAATIPGQRGQLTRVRSDGYERRFVYDREGRVHETTTTFPGWRSVTVQRDYHEDGSSAAETWIVRNAAGVELQRVATSRELDDSGRNANFAVNGTVAVHLEHDAEGVLAHVALATGEQIAISSDPLTRRTTGYRTTGGAAELGASWSLDARGLVTNELFSVGNASWNRAYQYDARGFLTRATDGAEDAGYSYAANGLPFDASDRAGSRTIAHSGASAVIGNNEYHWDGSGRVAGRDDLVVTYGPTGDIETARRGNRSWGYRYDEHGQRIAKEEGGVVTSAFLDGAFLNADGLVLPVKAGDRLVGVLDNGAFQALATDPRGSLLGDGSVANVATAFGVRATRPARAAALDYVERGFDEDLGTVRMGLRDYDPMLNQFWSPDALFLESIDQCAKSPSECNLYSYARNNPVSYIDPTGSTGTVTQQAYERWPLLAQRQPLTFWAATTVLEISQRYSNFAQLYSAWYKLSANSSVYVDNGQYKLQLSGTISQENAWLVLGHEFGKEMINSGRDAMLEGVGLGEVASYIGAWSTLYDAYMVLRTDAMTRMLGKDHSGVFEDKQKWVLMIHLTAENQHNPIFSNCLSGCGDENSRALFLTDALKKFLGINDVLHLYDNLESRERIRDGHPEPGPSIGPTR